MILTNPGGPGESSIDFLVGSADLAGDIIGPDFDIVAWEPRGVGYSMPLANCSVSASRASKIRLMGRELGTNYFSDDFFTEIYNEAQEIGDACVATIGGSTWRNYH